MSIEHSPRISWRSWGDEAFEQAQREDKLVLLNIGASWCHWCHVMERTTYADANVVRLVNERFIPVKVDADKRPDIQDRYLLGGWPTTAFLVPDGRIVTGTTFVPPEALVNKLHEVDMLYHEHKELVTMHVTSMAAEAEADRTQAETGLSSMDGEVIDRVTRALKSEYDPIHGGFGTEPKFPYPDAIQFAFLQYRRAGDREMLAIAVKSLDGVANLLDPVWGGLYRYAVDGAWQRPHYEKMLYVQAAGILNFLEAYEVTGEDRFGEAAASIKSYAMRFLADERGGFYGSQDADVGSHDSSVRLVTGEEYFARREESERFAMGVPYIDKAIYTDWNGLMISAFCRLYAVMGDTHALEFARRTADRIIAESMDGESVYHYFDGERRLPGLAADHTHFARGLIDIYQCSGERKYLDVAETLVDYMNRRMRDVVEGGYYYQIDDPHGIGELAERHKPFEENVAIARLLLELHYLTGKDEYKDLASRTIRAVSYPQIIDTVTGASLALVVDMYITPPAHIVVVGKPGDERTTRMLEAGLHAYEPQKIVQLLDSTCGPLAVGDCSFPPGDAPIAYVCLRNTCTPPIANPEELTATLSHILGDALS